VFATILGDHPEALIVGAALIAVYQTAKFAELDRGDPVISRYVTRVQGAKTKDFVGANSYYGALVAFLIVSLGFYYLVCQISEPVLSGVVQLLTGAKLKAPKDIPYPLYVAALFMGLTQPVIPWLAKLGDAQRNFFHNRIDVPRRVIDLTASLAVTVETRSGSNRKRLEHEVISLTDDDWLSRIKDLVDVPFYQSQLKEVGLGDPTKAVKTLHDSSAKELRERIEDLILFNLIAAIRKSGLKNLQQVASLIEPNHVIRPSTLGHYISALVLSGLVLGLAVLTIWHTLDLLRPTIEHTFGKGGLWPESEFLGTELARIVPSIFICLLIAAYMFPRADVKTKGRPGNGRRSLITFDFLVQFAQNNASALFLCFLVSLIIHFTAEFYQYGTAVEIAKNASNISLAKMTIVLVRTVPSLAVSYCALLYLSLGKPSFIAMLAIATTATSAFSFLVVETFLRFDILPAFPQYGAGWDYALFYVLANALVSMAAFASIVLFFRTQAIAPRTEAALRARLRRRRAT